MNRTLIVAIALGLAACDKQPEPVWVAVATEEKEPALPAECTSKDAAWRALPDTDIDMATLSRTDGANAEAFSSMSSKRRICRVAILASNQKGTARDR